MAITLLAAVVPLGALAAPGHSKSVMLHPTAAYKGKKAFAHVMAHATLRYTKSDVFIKLVTDGLPKPSTLGEKAYVLFATDGAMTERVGTLHITGNMGGVSGELMMTKVQDLSLYAVPSATEKHAMGKKVLTAMV
jgi:hypothetical protein